MKRVISTVLGLLMFISVAPRYSGEPVSTVSIIEQNNKIDVGTLADRTAYVVPQAPSCPRNITPTLAGNVTDAVTDISIDIHCKDCGMGVYSAREGSDTKRCSYCKSLEK